MYNYTDVQTKVLLVHAWFVVGKYCEKLFSIEKSGNFKVSQTGKCGEYLV